MARSFARCLRRLFLQPHVGTSSSGFATCCVQRIPTMTSERTSSHSTVKFCCGCANLGRTRFDANTHRKNTCFFENIYVKTCFLPWVRYRCGLIGGLATMESLMLRNGRWFSAVTVSEFETAYLCYRSSLNVLASHALGAKLLRYHMRPKIHQLGHIVYQFLPRNPKYYSCYLDEDMVSRVKNVAVVAPPLHTSRLAMQRYIIHVCMAWAGSSMTVWMEKCASAMCSHANVLSGFEVCFFYNRLRLYADP